MGVPTDSSEHPTKGKTMSKIAQHIEIEATTEQVWNALADVSYVHHWHPKVERSPAQTDQLRGVGAQRTCHFYDGTHVTEEVIALREGQRIDIAIIEAGMPIRDAVATFVLEPLPGGGTGVTVEMAYQMKLGPVGWLMDRLMVRRMMTKMLGQVLEGLRAHVVDGVYVGRDGLLQAAA